MMPSSTLVTNPKATTGHSGQTSQHLLLHESTSGFVRRLKTRGYPINMSLRDHLSQGLISVKSNAHPPHTPDYWLNMDSLWLLKRKQLSPEPDATLSPEMYCALLCGLQAFEIDYVNLAAVLHSMSVLEIRNLYRYCYLEWISRHPALQQLALDGNGGCGSGSGGGGCGGGCGPSSLSSTLWPCTPRAFKELCTEQLRIRWAETLRGLLSENVPSEQPPLMGAAAPPPATSRLSQRTRSLFFVNRLYSYLTPCG